MGSLRFELRSLRPERNRMVQATLRPRTHIHASHVGIQLINSLFVREKHASATVPIMSKRVENLFWVFAGSFALLIFFPYCGNYLPTRETSNWYH